MEISKGDTVILYPNDNGHGSGSYIVREDLEAETGAPLLLVARTHYGVDYLVPKGRIMLVRPKRETAVYDDDERF